MVATVSPAADSYEETLSTLRYADRQTQLTPNLPGPMLWSGCGSGFDLSTWCGSGFSFLFSFIIRIFVWCGCGSGSDLHPEADPDPYPSLQIKAKTLEKGLNRNRLIFNTFWLVICKLMRIRIRFRIQLTTLMRIRIQSFIFDADPDFYSMRMRFRKRNQVTEMMRAHEWGLKKSYTLG